jgi:hypothetical protein
MNKQGNTTEKCHSFIDIYEYIQIIFIGIKTDKYKVIFISLGRVPTNIWAVWFDFDRPHIFVGEATSQMNIIHVYTSVMWQHR